MPFDEQPSMWKFRRQPGDDALVASVDKDPYKQICDSLHRLMLSKSGYYGNADDGPLANALSVQDDGIEPWRYQLARIGEKCRRLRGAAAADGEALRATLTDIAGHAIVALACLDADK